MKVSRRKFLTGSAATAVATSGITLLSERRVEAGVLNGLNAKGSSGEPPGCLIRRRT